MDTLLPLALGAARGVHVASAMMLAGAILFHVAIAPLTLHRWVRPLLVVALASLGLWLVLQSAQMTGAAGPREALGAVPEVALHTRIGQSLLCKALSLIAVGLLAWRPGQRAELALPFALAGMVAPVAASHAAALGDDVLVWALAAHLLAASAWLGGLPPLWHVVTDKALSMPRRQDAVRRFSRLGLGAVVVLGITAAIQLPRMAGDIAGLFGTAYGQLMLGKTALFLALLGLATLNRFVFSPRMEQRAGLAGLRRGILLEMAIGVSVIGVAVLLSSTPPALHQQPVWPFPMRLDSWEWEPLPADRIAWPIAIMTLLGLATLGCWRRRPQARWGVLTAALLVPAGYAMASLHVALVPATPSSFQTAPAGFSTDAIRRGEALVARYPALNAPPAMAVTEGDLFWFASQATPGLDAALHWDAAAFLRATQAGQQVRRDGGWQQPLRAPDMPLLCREGGGTTLSALGGQVVRIAVGFAPAVSGALTVSLDRDLGPGIDCATTDPTARDAYALLAGVAGERMNGLWLLMDGHGWLRGSGLGTIPEILEEAARAIGAAPLEEGRAHH